jgi:hypothetical protein
MSRRALFAFCVSSVLLTCCGVMAPIAYQDGLPAWTLQNGAQEFRVGASRMLFSDDSVRKTVGDGEWYITPGWRIGGAHGSWMAEYGIQALTEFRPPEFHLAGCVSAGMTWTDPSIALRLSWYAFHLGYVPSDGRVDLSPTPYYQLSLLVGNDRARHGLHGAAGVRMSPLAEGPLLVGEYSLGRAALRAEASLMFPPPMFLPPLWWLGPSNIKGNTLSLGVTVAAATAPTRPPR